MDLNEIIDTVKAGGEYVSALKVLEQNVKSAEQQILQSAQEAEENIKKSFSNLLEVMQKSLKERETFLLKQIQETKYKSVQPLQDCKKMINDKIEGTNKFVTLGVNLVNNPEENHMTIFLQNAKILGSLPEVPHLKEVPCFSYNSDEKTIKELTTHISNFGTLLSIAPVQITNIVGKPGSVLVEWEYSDHDEKLMDVDEFRLQRSIGYDNIFSDCYIGSESQYLVRDLQVDEFYSFRVCCKYEGSHIWSPWSIPQVGLTSMKPYSWCQSDNFIYYDSCKIVKPNNQEKLIFSKQAQFHVGCSVEFTFLECDPDLSETYIGLALSNNYKSFEEFKEDCFAIEANGQIYVNGMKKSTKLPELKPGSKICFQCDVINGSKILITVISANKQVTYDWLLTNEDKMYFFANLNSPNFKILIE